MLDIEFTEMMNALAWPMFWLFWLAAIICCGFWVGVFLGWAIALVCVIVLRTLAGLVFRIMG